MKAADMRWAIVLILGLFGLPALVPAAPAETPYRYPTPDWVPLPVTPPDNPMSEAKVALGRHLFYETALSADGSMSCSSCHHQELAFTDGQPTHAGVHGEPGLRNAQSLANVAYFPTLTWSNPNLTRLEQQILVPLFGDRPVELGMAGRERDLFAALAANPVYPPLFDAAFPDTGGAIDLSSVTRGLAAFMRSIMSFSSPYDRFVREGDTAAMSAAALRGEALFFSEKLECAHCHGGLNFTDNTHRQGQSYPETGFHNTGLYNLDGAGAYPAPNVGLREFTLEKTDEGRFRTPSLRNVAVTGPYMHDGSIPTLEAVIRDHYALGGRAASGPHGRSPLRDPFIEGFSITDGEIADLVAFLESLTDEAFLADPRFSNPFAGQ
ncbi:methanobactin export MATE transporter MbnM [Devosia sediminis]|uniref:Di-heme enzyme n=1 Tax=Devosia sediminis TaxID=2798801 RepID=A0A934IUQ1_9HYPH|nr:methanobactin export MATE transporter MbnM [Devosia sediminis]MBJ3784702.1 di-heme enzyme [Devosia sediminis]